jgi:hypothetical protein
MRETHPQSDDQSSQPIGDNHRRRIKAALGLIDAALGRWEKYAAGAADTGALRHLRNDLSGTQRRKLQQLTTSLREILTALQRELGLEAEVRTVRGILPGECGILWETIAALDPNHLSAWGETTAQFDAYWEPKRQMLEDMLNQVMDVVSGKP